MGSETPGGAPISSAMSGINVQQLHAGRLQPVLEDLAKALKQLVAEVVILLAFVAQTFAVERDGAGEFDGASIRAPKIWGDQPGPSEDVVFLERFDGDGRAVRLKDLQRHAALAQEIELIGLLALAEQVSTRLETHVGRAADQQFQVLGIETFEKRVLSQNPLK